MPQPIPSEDLPPFERLRQIMHTLRAPGGCSWDAEQTHESLLKHLIEESYEVAEAVRGGDDAEIVDELGDLLLQPVFHAEIAEEQGRFSIDDVARAICEKLIRRHPHVFADSIADDPDAVLTQWEKIKEQEKSGSKRDESNARQDSIVKKGTEGMPALMAAQKFQKTVAKVGFDWPDLPPVIDKVKEELAEVEEAISEKTSEDVAEEIGDLLFSVVNLARKTGNEAELLLAAANQKFVKRFQAVEVAMHAQGRSLADATLEEMDEAWEAAK